MNKDWTCLRDPADGGVLVIEIDTINSVNGLNYPIVRGIPRFVDIENYSDDFGAQWNMFPKTQLDSFTNLDISESRLARCFRGNLANLKGKKVLEAGSGAGRFTEILLKYGAIVHSFDFSNAVDANSKNNGGHENLVLVQADIRKIPFPKADYDYVMCLGVLQHTPSPEESMKCLWEMVKPGGALVIDHYRWTWRLALLPPFGDSVILYRQLVLRLPKKVRFKFIQAVTDFWFPWHWKFKDSLTMQRILRRLSPVRFYYPDLKLRDRQMFYEWSLLDTHDSTTDFYKHLRKPEQIKNLFEELCATDIVADIGGNGVEAFCRKSVK